MTMKEQSGRNAGFSLVEIALALMVTAVGMMGVMSLIPASLDLNKRAIEDGQLSLFADQVLNGYRAEVLRNPWAQRFNHTLSPMSPEVWIISAGNPLTVEPEPGTGLSTNFYTYKSAGGRFVEDLVVRYRLRVENSNFDPNILECELEVWPGQFGSELNPLTYYTEIYRGDGL